MATKETDKHAHHLQGVGGLIVKARRHFHGHFIKDNFIFCRIVSGNFLHRTRDKPDMMTAQLVAAYIRHLTEKD